VPCIFAILAHLTLIYIDLQGGLFPMPCVALNCTPSCNPKVKLWPSRGLRADTRSQWRHRVIYCPFPATTHPGTGFGVCLHYHSLTFIFPCRIRSIPRPHPLRHLLVFRGLSSSPPIFWQLPLRSSRFPIAAGLLACLRLALRHPIQTEFFTGESNSGFNIWYQSHNFGERCCPFQ
jgi:hypothetical protein